jgi:hypothetical protein
VFNDTKKGLAVLRRDGIIAWHDYVPHDDIHEQCESVRGVATALHHCADFLKKELTDVFWIDPSWLLIGIKA